MVPLERRVTPVGAVFGSLHGNVPHVLHLGGREIEGRGFPAGLRTGPGREALRYARHHGIPLKSALFVGEGLPEQDCVRGGFAGEEGPHRNPGDGSTPRVYNTTGHRPRSKKLHGTHFGLGLLYRKKRRRGGIRIFHPPQKGTTLRKGLKVDGGQACRVGHVPANLIWAQQGDQGTRHRRSVFTDNLNLVRRKRPKPHPRKLHIRPFKDRRFNMLRVRWKKARRRVNADRVFALPRRELEIPTGARADYGGV